MKYDSFKDVLDEIMKNYLTEKDKDFADNYLASLTRKDWKDTINLGLIDNGLKLNGSAGKGRWALVPWLGLFDEQISSSAPYGVYLVYLFSADMQKVYLTLEQGWTQYKNNFKKLGKRNIQDVTSFLQDKLQSTNRKMIKEIDLIGQLPKKHGSTDLAVGYQNGAIFSIEYEVGKIPSDETLMTDLAAMIGLLQETKRIIRDRVSGTTDRQRTFLNFINSVLNEPKYYLQDQPKPKESHKVQSNHNNDDFVFAPDDVLVGNEVVPPKQDSNKRSNRIKPDYKPDYESRNRDLEKLGKVGEELVYKYERRQLEKENPELSEKVEWVSQTDDSAGYDILSYLPDGSKKYIEVKTTTSSNTTRFIVSCNEVDVSESKNNYVLVRIFGLKKGSVNNKIDYYLLHGSLKNREDLLLVPLNYEATPK